MLGQAAGLSEGSQIIQGLNCIKKALISIDDKLRVLRDAELEKKKILYIDITQEVVIPQSAVFTTQSLNNPGFNRCRVDEMSVKFDPSASAGVSVNLIYGNSPVARLTDVVSGNGSTIYKSEPIDVNHFSGFQFELVNKDTSNSVGIGNMRVILYNE